MFLTNLRVGARLGLGFAVVLALLISLAMLGLTRMAQTEVKSEEIVQGDRARIARVNEMREQVQTIAVAVRDIVLVIEAGDITIEAKRIENAHDSYDIKSKVLTSVVMNDADKVLLARIDESRSTTRTAINKVLELGVANKKGKAMGVLLTELRPNLHKWLQALDEMVVSQNNATEKKIEENKAAYASARIQMLSITITALLLGLAIAWFITRSITRPLQQAVRIANAVAQGDLTQRIEVKSTDETGQLLLALKDMNENLAGIVGDVRDATDSIATAAKQIAVGNSDLSQRTEEQASSLEETASSMEELTSTVGLNAENAKQASQLAAMASAAAMRGAEATANMIGNMDAIGDSSKKIGDIISVIDGIAFQTNILALNAAVEAARAGEQGRGFAVVASEVRNLAQRSAAAAKEIKILIGDSAEKVASGSRLLESSVEVISEAVGEVRRVTNLIAEISVASQEQRSGIEQVNQAITQMDEVTQQNAALVEEAAAAAESMQEQANILMEAVSVFKLETVAEHQIRAVPAQLAPRRAVSSARGAPVKRIPKLAKAADDAEEWKEF